MELFNDFAAAAEDCDAGVQPADAIAVAAFSFKRPQVLRLPGESKTTFVMRRFGFMDAVRNAKKIVKFFRDRELCSFDGQIVPRAVAIQRGSLRGGKSFGYLGRDFGSLGAASGVLQGYQGVRGAPMGVRGARMGVFGESFGSFGAASGILGREMDERGASSPEHRRSGQEALQLRNADAAFLAEKDHYSVAGPLVLRPILPLGTVLVAISAVLKI